MQYEFIKNISSSASKIASTAGVGTVLAGLRWKPLRRAVMANPVKSALVLALGAGAVYLARRVMSRAQNSDYSGMSPQQKKMKGEELAH